MLSNILQRLDLMHKFIVNTKQPATIWAVGDWRLFAPSTTVMQCLFDEAKRRYFRTKKMLLLERLEAEELVLELVKCKCLPILLYGLECCPLNKSDVKSLQYCSLLDEPKSVNIDLINKCLFCFNFLLPSELLKKRTVKFLKNEGIGLAT